jgi:hypothetical protein
MSPLRAETSATTEAPVQPITSDTARLAASSADSNPVSPYLSTTDVAARYHTVPKIIRERVAEGRLPYFRPAGTRRLLFIPAHLDAFDAGAKLERLTLPNRGECVRPVIS